MKIGTLVKFKDRVFGLRSPYYPYYEEYLGFADFTIISIEDEHVELAHPSIVVKGWVHLMDLQPC